MIHELTKEQSEMVEYSDTHSYSETCEKFLVTKSQIGYFRNKRKRIEERCKTVSGTFVEVSMSTILEKEKQSNEEEITFTINNARIKMKPSDFRKVFLND